VLQDQSQPKESRLAAIKALGIPGNHKVILPLQAAMQEESLANACGHALIQIRSRRHCRRLLNFLTTTTPDYLKLEAIYCLWMLDDRRGTSTLAKIALDRNRESERIRLFATNALGNNTHKRFVQRTLVQLLEDPSVYIRKSVLCAAGAGKISAPLARALHARLNDPEPIYDRPFGEHVRELLEGHNLLVGDRLV
jgi:HEAT repeat protein